MIKRIVGVSGVVCLLFSLLLGCGATIGPAPAKLSEEVGDRVADMQGLHVQAVRNFFDSERQRVDEFLTTRWIPAFMQNYLATSNLMKVLEDYRYIGEIERNRLEETLKLYLEDSTEAPTAAGEVVSALSGLRSQESSTVKGVLSRYVEDDRLEVATVHVNSVIQAADPGQLVLEWAQDAQTQIDLQRREMLAPLDNAERTIIGELVTAYGEILKANGVVTARLEAAAKVTASQNRLLDEFGVRKQADNLRVQLARISSTVGEAVSAADQALGEIPETGLPGGDRTKAAVNELKRILNGLLPEQSNGQSVPSNSGSVSE